MEIQHFFGNDLTLGVNGDIAQAQGDALTQQSIIRRLLTNPGSYIWHIEYGAGIGRFVGELLSEQNFVNITNTMVSQILMESTVAQSPLPQVTVKAVTGNILVTNVVYTDAVSNTPQTISFEVS